MTYPAETKSLNKLRNYNFFPCCGASTRFVVMASSYGTSWSHLLDTL